MHKYWLWSSSRMKWVKKTRKGCLFCGIAKGDKNIPSKVLYKDKDMMVIMNIFPYNTGHLQVIPIRHVRELEELKDEEFNKFFLMVKKSVQLLKKALKPTGFNIGFNIGEKAGASVEHLHIHIVPRYKRDFGFMEIIAKTKVVPETVEQTYERLKKWVKILESNY